MPLIISLTSIPSRFYNIQETLDCLCAQTAHIDEIRLNIPKSYTRFPDWDGTLPDVPDGVTIHRPETDMGPATKLLPTLRDFADTPDARILFCDDDRVYMPDWAANLIAAHDERPDTAVCLGGLDLEKIGIHPTDPNRAQPRAQLKNKSNDLEYRLARIRQQWKAKTLRAVRRKPPRRLFRDAGYLDIAEGYGGVIVTPSMFTERVFDVPKEGWQDDVWFSGNLAANGVLIWTPAGLYSPQVTVADRNDALFREVFDGRNRDALNVACVEFCQRELGVWAAG